jgi:hypothetical protein
MDNAENKTALMAQWGSLTAKLSTNSYVDISPSWHVSFFRTKMLRFTAATNDLLVNVLGSIDGGLTYTEAVESDIAVAAAATVTKTYTAAYTHLKVQLKAAVGGSQGTLSTKVFGSWL